MKRVLSAILALGLAVGIAPAFEVVYQTGFEAAQGFNQAEFSNVDGWVVQNGVARVSTTVFRNGSQSLELPANTTIDRSFVDVTSLANQRIVWVQGYFRGTGSAGTPDFAGIQDASAVLFFGNTAIQAFQGSGALDGNGSFVSTGRQISNSAWTRILLKLDFQLKNYDVYIVPEGQSLSTASLTNSALSFRNNVSRLNGFQSLASETSFIDDFSVLVRVPFDANGDGVVNVADLVTVVNAINTPSTLSDPILRTNADANLDGQLTTADRDAILNSATLLNI